MLLGRSVTDSISRFDDEINNYFNKSKKCRSRLRRGSVVVVDPGDKLFEFLTFMVEHCGLDVNVMHLKSVVDAKGAIEKMRGNELKVVIMDTSMVNIRANGNSLPSWMDKKFPNVPVWVNNCEPEREQAVRRLSMRAGIILDGHPVSDFVDILGFPHEAHKYAEEYVAG